MKMVICQKQIIVTTLLQQVVKTLLQERPAARLLHADIETKEEKSNSVNTHLYVHGSFVVQMGAVRIELRINAHFYKSECSGLARHLAEWRLNSCSVKEPGSEEQLQMIMHNGMPHVWNTEGKRGEFLDLIGAR